MAGDVAGDVKTLSVRHGPAPVFKLCIGLLSVGPDRYCSPHHLLAYNSSNEGSKFVGRHGEQYLFGPRLRERTPVRC